MTQIFIIFQGRDGEIKHLYRNFAFLHSRMYLDNGGVFVCKTRHLQLAGGSKASPTAGLGGQSPFHGGFMSPRIAASPRHPGGGGGGGQRGRGGGQRGGRFGVRRDRDIIGQTIKITGGPYKGQYFLCFYDVF